MPFGYVLRDLRKKNDLTQKQLSEIIGVSESTIGMYERCQREPDFETLEAISDYFNVDMDYLTGRSDIERRYTYSPSAPSSSGLILTDAEETLIRDYRDASEEIREEAAGMLHRSAERNRKDGSSSALSAG